MFSAINLASLTALCLQIVKALLIYVIGRIAIDLIIKAVKKGLEKTSLDPMLHKFICNVIKVICWAEIVIAIMTVFGFNASSLLTVFAAAGAAVALALQGSLSNFASGILIMVNKPFKKGDYVVCGGGEGFVESIDLMATTLVTMDNRVTIVPNSQITGASITNVSKKDTRRVDMQIGVAYNTDIDYAKKVITDFINSDPRVLKDPAVFCEVTKYDKNAVELEMRAWCNGADYWGVKFDIQSALKGVLTNAGIAIPYPQVDVHIKDNK
ncbi:MAG: mechanosensitive ion channel family protein [Firmicutes bacterium]|nr:mechanosensitive ion channel family protein [Bacillota bacterium]MBQ1887405.1 mechanosensitive ion channel family protein [Bacillota bacterium]MBQ2455330.1 mechanosensitive ion channel family protein [Bacillota bacterium]MBQ3577765.1 mechanosensitive ion channel family protein [Bacillota bacterium]MBQ4181775.1 mechanosensitive ion channel family protein [Bacillota bacterium]